MSPVLPSIGTRMGPGWGPWLKHAPFERGRDFGEVLREQVRFRMVRSGATSVDDVRPDSAAAAKLWERPRTKEFVQGVLDLANQVSGTDATPLRGFSLSTSEAGYVANRAVHHFRKGSPSRDAYEAALQASRRHVSETAAIRKGAWLHLDPQRSAGLIEVLRRPDADVSDATRDAVGAGVKTLLHELNHVASPRPRRAGAFDWLSEGTAETLARWPGRVRSAAKELGVPVPPRVGQRFDEAGKPYQEEVDSVRSLLRLAGIDPARASNFAEAERLLNEPAEPDVARELAERIADRHARGSTAERALARRLAGHISKLVAPDGTNADPAVVRRLAKQLHEARPRD